MRSQQVLGALGLIGLMAVTAQVAAQSVASDQQLMSCPTRNGKHIDVTVQPGSPDVPGSFSYSFGVKGKKPELSLSVPMSAGTVVPWPGIGQSVWSSVKFQNGDYVYEAWHGFDRSDEDSELEGGIRIIRNEEVIARYQCHGGYIAPLFLLEEAMAAAGYCWNFENSRWQQNPCR